MESVNVAMHAPVKEILQEIFATQLIANANVTKQEMNVWMANSTPE